MSGMKNIYPKVSIAVIIILGFLIISSLVGIGIGKAYWYGLTVDSLNSQNRNYYNLSPDDAGVVVVEISGKAENAGVEEGDLVTGINGKVVDNVKSFLSAAKKADNGGDVVLDIVRDGRKMVFSLPGKGNNKGAYDNVAGINSGLNSGQPFNLTAGANIPVDKVKNRKIPTEGVWLGMEIEAIGPGAIKELSLPPNQTGILADDVPPGSEAEKSGLKNGDIITSINGQLIVNMADYIKATNNQKLKKANLVIVRDGNTLFLTIPPVNTGQLPAFDNQPMTNTAPGITINAAMVHAYRGVCVNCHKIIDGPALTEQSVISPVANTNIQSTTGLPSPAEQNAATKVLIEGHWLGMELIPITPELAREYRLPKGMGGLLVDEVTLEAAESGLLAGDVLQSINGYSITTLEDFTKATKMIESLKRAQLGVLRQGKPVSLILETSRRKLGFSQNEAAQPIQPGAITPHRNNGRPCTDCHIIMQNGGQLPTDAGDILPSPPPIKSNATAPHSYRGTCNTCHIILK